MIARRIVVRGFVQGVGFRYSMVGVAPDIGVRGWVRNRSDGSVEAFVQGDAAAVERATAWCRHGPPGARVTEVECSDANLDPELTGFATRPSV